MRKWIVSMLLAAIPCVALAADQVGISKKELDAKFDQLFKAVDANEDGKISRAEAELKAPAMAENFDAIDTKHDGGLTKAEIRAFTAALEEKRRAFSHKLEKADKDKNGVLTRDEAKVLPGLSTHFDEVDSNHDGQLIIKEIADFLRGGSNATPAPNSAALVTPAPSP